MYRTITYSYRYLGFGFIKQRLIQKSRQSWVNYSFEYFDKKASIVKRHLSK